MSFFHDTLTVFRRQWRLSMRNPAWVIIAVIQPVLYLVLFGPLLSLRRDLCDFLDEVRGMGRACASWQRQTAARPGFRACEAGCL